MIRWWWWLIVAVAVGFVLRGIDDYLDHRPQGHPLKRRER